MKLAIVSTVYNGAKTIEDFLDKLDSALAIPELEKPSILHLVDDGSEDNSIEIIKSVSLRNIQVRLVCLAKNYGHHKAIFTGIRDMDEVVDYLVIIDSDGEENPQDIVRLIQEISDSNIDGILTFQKNRSNDLPSRILASVSDAFLSLVSDSHFIKGVCTLRIMKRHVAMALASIEDKDPILGVAQQKLGLKFSKVEIIKEYKGFTNYTSRKRFKLFLKLLSLGSDFYTRVTSFVGNLGLVASILSLIWFVAYRLFSTEPLPGYASLGLIISIIGGTSIFLLSVVIKILIYALNASIGLPSVVIKESHVIP